MVAIMTEADIYKLSLVQAAGLIRSRQLSPGELVKAYLERIDHLDRKLNSFITVTAEMALQRAGLAESELARAKTHAGSRLSPLHGVPIAFKDLYETRAIRTTAGSKFYADYIPTEDAAVVEKLSASGAILLGKNNMHEIALGLTNINPHFGTCHNPWALDRVTGGSSGGSAAAVAARLCPASMGTDTGGSIRVPSALCGVVGLKPTFGRISLHGVLPLSWNLDHAGPIARDVEDVAALLQVVAGYDPRDPYTLDVPVDDYLTSLRQGIKGWRIALADDEYINNAEPQVVQAVHRAAAVFEQLGAHVEATPFPGAYSAAQANGMMVISDAAVFHQDRLAQHPEDFGADVLTRLQNGAALPLKDYIQARRTQALLRRQFTSFLDQYDLLLMPTTPVPAPPIEGPNGIEMARLLTLFTAPFNLTGLPALSIPCGFTSLGLPIGLQIIARPWAEARVLQAGYAYEQATEWHLKETPL
jgi:aspartyl-tRNA(Asn)/glutamyl-tRNA(Gln) amidotransferase subunit A